MKLYLVRHGDAVPETADPRRPLSLRGRGEVQKTADFLKSQGYSVTKFLHSTKLRARQTAEILRDTLCRDGMLVEKEYLSPNDAIDQILCDIETASQDFFIAGHMPFLSYLVSSLLTGGAAGASVAFPTGGVVVLERKAHQWALLARYPSQEK